MPLLASYASQESPFHRLDPRTKLTWLVVALGLASPSIAFRSTWHW